MAPLLLCPSLFLALAALLPASEAQRGIVGGTEVPRSAHPYHVRAVVTRRRYNTFCSATIVNSRHFLTAARCVYPKADNVTLELSYNLAHNYSSSDVIVQVQKVIIHPGYRPKTLKNDIAILRTVNPVDLKRGPKAVVLPPSGFKNPAYGTAASWGEIRQFNRPIKAMFQLDHMPVLQDQDCLDSYGSKFNPTSMVCAGYVFGGMMGVCDGDGGSPLMDKSTQIGVFSFAQGCAVEGFPAVYTKVAAYRQWIDYYCQ